MFKKASLLFALAAVPFFAFAAEVHIGDYFLRGAEKVPDDAYIVGDNATFAGKVSGDAVSLGRTIFSESDISGDALFIGEEVTAAGVIQDDARILGGVVIVNGDVADDLIVIGSKVTIGPKARIGGSLYVIGAKVDIQGSVAGDAKVLATELTMNGSVEGDLELWGKSSFRKPARIGKDLIYHGDDPAVSLTNVVITGKLVVVEAKQTFVNFSDALGGFFALKLLMALALGFFFFFLARGRTEEVLLETLAHFWPRVLRGLLIIIVLPVLAILLLPSVVGIPIALLLGALFTLLLVCSVACAGILCGVWIERFMFRRAPTPLSYRTVLLGILSLSLLSLIPFLGPLLHALLIVAAAGSVGTLFYRQLKNTR